MLDGNGRREPNNLRAFLTLHSSALEKFVRGTKLKRKIVN